MYLTRHHFCYSNVFQDLNNLRPLDWLTIKRLFCYLKGTPKHGIEFTKNIQQQNLSMIKNNDVDWVGDLHGRKSNFEYTFIVTMGACKLGQ
jgi:hypothetical protein